MLIPIEYTEAGDELYVSYGASGNDFLLVECESRLSSVTAMIVSAFLQAM